MAFLDAENRTDLASPGLGIVMLSFMDGIVFFTLLMMTLAVVVPARVFGAIQGIITFIIMLLTLIGGIVSIFIAVGLLVLMVTLLAAVPFGTAFYMATYGTFALTEARAALAAIFFFKTAGIVCIFLAQQKFLAVKGLVFLLLSSFLVGFIVSLLHAFPPGVLVSIADAIAAIIVGIIAAIWAMLKLIGSIPGVIKGLRLDRHVT